MSLSYISHSKQRQQSLPHGAQRRPLASQRLQQRPQLLLLLLAGQPAAAAGLRRPAAQQAQALPDHPATVRQRHLARDRRARPHAGARTGGEYQLPCASAPVQKGAERGLEAGGTWNKWIHSPAV